FILAFTHIAPAHILVDKDVTLAREQFVWAQRTLVFIIAVRCDAVGRAVEHDRVLLVLVFRLVNTGKQLYAVAHGDSYFAFGVVTLDVVGEFLLFFRELVLGL